MSFALLKQEYSDDRNRLVDAVLGPYVLLDGVMPRRRTDNIVEMPRENYARRVADLVFSLEQGEFGIADYDEKLSPYGWHVVKVLERE